MLISIYHGQNAVERPPRLMGGWMGTYCINIFVVVWVLVVGFGFGGWASMVNFVRQINTFGLFTKCYQCPSHKPWYSRIGWEIEDLLERWFRLSVFCFKIKYIYKKSYLGYYSLLKMVTSICNCLTTIIFYTGFAYLLCWVV